MISHFTQQTADYGVVTAIYHHHLLQFVLKGYVYIPYARALYHGWQASSSILLVVSSFVEQ